MEQEHKQQVSKQVPPSLGGAGGGPYRYETSRTGNYPLLKEFAQNNRKYPTDAETILWQYLRGRNLGHRFRRQHPIGNYIADFVCLEARLVVEVDGKYHDRPDIIKEDTERTKSLERQGFRVIRFSNGEVISDPGKVAIKIKEYLGASQALSHDLHQLKEERDDEVKEQ